MVAEDLARETYLPEEVVVFEDLEFCFGHTLRFAFEVLDPAGGTTGDGRFGVQKSTLDTNAVSYLVVSRRHRKRKSLHRASSQVIRAKKLTIFTTDRLLLREFVEDDWQAVLNYQSDVRYLNYSPWTYRTAEEVQDFIGDFIKWQGERPRIEYQLAIVLRGEGRLIGNCGIRLESADSRQASLGYEIAPGYWGEGYATEAARAMVAFGFEELRLHRICARCVAENVASYRVLEKVGMRREGRLREEEWMKGRWWNALVYGVLEHEWRSRA